MIVKFALLFTECKLSKIIKAKIPNAEIMLSVKLLPHVVLTINKLVAYRGQCLDCSGMARIGCSVLKTAYVIKIIDWIFIAFKNASCLGGNIACWGS